MSKPDPEALLRLEAQMRVAGRRMRRTSHARGAALDPSLGTVGFLVLDSVLNDGPSRQADLVHALDVDKGAVSRAVRGLLELGLVEKVDDPTDGRAHRVAATASGRRRMREVRAAQRTSYAAKLAGWARADLESFVALMTRYNDDLER